MADTATTPALRALPGIGKRPRAAHPRDRRDRRHAVSARNCSPPFPATLLDLLRLQGVGPKTVKRLYDELGVTSLDTLEQAAATDGRVRALKGMGVKKEALILGHRGAPALRRPAPVGRRRAASRDAVVGALTPP